MTPFEHMLLGGFLLMIFWYLFAKRFFIFPGELEWWEERIKKFLNK